MAKEAQQATNQATADDDDDWMDAASNDFPKIEHLAPSLPPNFGEGRLVAIWARKMGQGKKKVPDAKGALYDFVETVTLVLDDGKDGKQTNEMVPAAPIRLDGMQHSTGNILGKLKGRVTGKHPKTGKPLRNIPLIGRVNTQQSQASKNQPAYGLAEPTPEDMEIARKYRDTIKKINAELAAEDEAAADAEAF